MDFVGVIFWLLLGCAIGWFLADRQGMKDTLLDWQDRARERMPEGEQVQEGLIAARHAVRRNLLVLVIGLVILAVIVTAISAALTPPVPSFHLGDNFGVRDNCGNTETINVTQEALALTKYVVIAGRDDRPTGGKDCRFIYKLKSAPAQQNSGSDQIK